MPSDCQNLGGGGHRHIHPLEPKSWGGGQLPPLPPGSRAPGHRWQSWSYDHHPRMDTRGTLAELVTMKDLCLWFQG